MMLTSTEHQAVQRETLGRRNAAARESRVRVSESTVLEASSPDGTRYTLVLSAKENWRAYVLWHNPQTGGLACGCSQYVWRKACQHTESYAALAPAGSVPGAPPPLPTRRR